MFGLVADVGFALGGAAEAVGKVGKRLYLPVATQKDVVIIFSGPS